MEKSKQSSTKRRKQNTPSIDRLSALPDDVVCHILSFLSTRASVQTSVLARRWRSLWAHVPNIYFQSEFYQTEFEFGKNFSDVIYRVMLLYKVRDMNTFCLSYADDFNEYQLETCVTTAIFRNVKKIDLSLVNDQVKLPSCIFTCETLVDLSLNYCSYIPRAGAVCLPALKKLFLGMVRFESSESLTGLVSGCPVLEELTVYRMVDSGLFRFCVSSPTLIRLMLDSNLNSIEKSYSEPYRVKIDTPALRYLQLKDSVSEDLSVGSLDSLIEADIVFNNGAPVQRDVPYSHSVLEFAAALRNVRFLKLSTDCMKVPDSVFSAWTMKFTNLTRLELDSDSRFISTFLENADNLEVLIIRTVFKELKCWMEPHVVPKCLLSHLSTIRIDQFECIEDEFKMVRYLLRNAKVLKRMEIYPQRRGIGSNEKLDALKRISLFQRGSEACELAFD
ncbi:F-box/FBD/LRR-repeat protein at1g16930 [Phtheirospermum japonicum]|uniref:F-box/FBD/LRR-repeat protein at1g16930 n=1 Tax=Phtheirospermum japonicum TaxID=374723 RepID=A0A830DB63_9LAMI|nr:F-box/FBD/LRR-repeat protein at1g16930 [Phtheirospermum japonicum]